MNFGLCFLKWSGCMTDKDLVQVDPTHWVLDLRQFVGMNFLDVKDVCLFLPAQSPLEANSALSLYVQAGGSEWMYRGCVCSLRPSETFPIQWPLDSADPQFPAQIGISIEPLAAVSQKEEQISGSKENFAKRVALDLFTFMQSFQGSIPTSHEPPLVVPANFVDRWFVKFQGKFRRDPDFLTRDGDKI
eukprot:CAMPEP_0198204714 /NCGR_PEP_ID=MMETSP1445-20131203/8163_1 /TAXON_ID=36898 /ORGANISM="Pyramimonas sp., Strain CCMP2087" /LENGTH=187 /DNA_ID=CAMNT_0043876725 /DNA_START=285 /DNA_END=848 /DNA_ORIENTATION=-